MFLPILLRAEKAHFLRSSYVGWGGLASGGGVMIEAHFGCGGMKPEKLQPGNVDCVALKLQRKSVSFVRGRRQMTLCFLNVIINCALKKRDC